MVKNTAISFVSLPLFLWVPPLLWEPSYFCNDSCGCVGTLTSSGSPPLLHALPHSCGLPDLAGSACLSAHSDGGGQEFQEMQTLSWEITSSLMGIHCGTALCPHWWCPAVGSHDPLPFLWAVFKWAHGSLILTLLPSRAGHLPFLPASQSQWKKITSILRPKRQRPPFIKGRPATECV